MIYILFILVIILIVSVVAEWMLIVQLMDRIDGILHCLDVAKKEIGDAKRGKNL